MAGPSPIPMPPTAVQIAIALPRSSRWMMRASRKPPDAVVDREPAPAVHIAAVRSLEGERQTLLDDAALDRAVEVEALAHGAGRREELVGGQLEHCVAPR